MTTPASQLSSQTACNDTIMQKSRLKNLRERILIGELPKDFLRLHSSSPINRFQEQYSHPHQHNVTSQEHLPQYQPQIIPIEHAYCFTPPNTRGRITVKIAEAKLTKNYGLPGIRMDPYARVRIGGVVFETPTSINGGKSPSWNRTINAYLPDGVESIYLQIYDERAFTQDECIAWAHIILPEAIFNNETIDDWYRLSGPQGEEKEGLINLTISFAPIQRSSVDSIQVTGTNTDQDVQELCSMFPNIDIELIRSVLEAKGNKCEAAASLIEMTN